MEEEEVKSIDTTPEGPRELTRFEITLICNAISDYFDGLKKEYDKLHSKWLAGKTETFSLAEGRTKLSDEMSHNQLRRETLLTASEKLRCGTPAAMRVGD